MQIDQSLLVPEYSQVCTFCRHARADAKRRCAAFDEVPIPLVIWLGQNPHTAPFPGDNGIQFEPAAPVAEGGIDGPTT